MTLHPISLTLPNTTRQRSPWTQCPPVGMVDLPVKHDDVDNPMRFGGSGRLALALLAATLVANTGCMNSRYAVPNSTQARQDAREADAKPRANRLGTYLENEYGMSTEKANALLLLPYAQFPGFFPSRFDVNNKGSAVSDSQSVIPELARAQVSAQDLRDLRAMLVDPSTVMPELPLKYDVNTQRHQILSTVRSRSMNREFRASSFSQKPLSYVQIIKTDLFMTQQRTEAEMAQVYRNWGMSKTQVESLAAMGNAMASRDRLPQIPGVTFEEAVNFPKGLNRHWQMLGIDHPKSLATLSDAHFEALRHTVETAQPKPQAKISREDAFMAADRAFMTWVKTEAGFGNLKYWANKPPRDFAVFLADKAGYEPPRFEPGEPPARLLPPQRDDALPPPADVLPPGLLEGPVNPLPKAMPKPNPAPPERQVPLHPERIAGVPVNPVLVSESAKR